MTRLAARGILATGVVDRAYEAVDRAYKLFDRLRSELVSALASDAVLDAFNDLIYEYLSSRPTEAGGRDGLFQWEESVLREFFPTPPARILVGGAGAGREAFVLAKRGFDVVAFDPSPALVEAMAAHAPKGANLDVRHGRYEDMDELLALEGSASFAGAILGWGSFSHLRNERTRVATLTSFGRLATGPILVSFTPGETAVSPRLARFRQLVPRRPARDVDGKFSVGAGFFHLVDEDEVGALARQAGLEIRKLEFDKHHVIPPYVVLAA